MACSTAQVTAFQNACGSFDWTYPPCVDWFSAPANATCGACVRPTEDAGTNTASGVSIYDMHGKAYPNIAGCDAVIDGNTGCADPFQRAAICDVNACSSSACASASASDFMSCLTAAGYGVCATYTGTFANACQADLAGPLSSSGACSTIAGIVYTICGNGT